jgi:carboxyl-terminal processing protease
VTRARIELAQLQARVIEGGVVYVRPLRFGRGVAEAVSGRLRELGGQGAAGVVLDLRGNAGGLTNEAVEIAGLFLGPEVVARIRDAGGQEELRAEGPAVTGLPLAVLVDGGTASAAELVAGALQDHGRGTLVGTQTYGKGSLLAVSEIEGAGGSIRYTTGTFTTPEGNGVEGAGLIPDVPVLPGGPIDAQLDRAVRVLLGEAAP